MKFLVSALAALALLIPCLADSAELPKLNMALSPQVAGEQLPAQPGAPSGLTLVIVPSGFRLTWSPASHAQGSVTGYEIVRATIFSGPYETVARVGKDMTMYTDTTALKEIIYFYKVRAIAGDQHSPFSREVTGEIPGAP